MAARSTLVYALATLVGVAALAGCSEVRARHHAREGNRLFRDGEYAAAVREYREAERLCPGLPAVALNMGLACRQLLIPGSRTPENEKAASCALESFERFSKLAPDDRRGEQLRTQTLFDADRFEQLAAIYERQVRDRPANLAAINGLIQVYSRWNRWEKTLEWMVRRADLQRDPEAHYAVGAFIQNLLFEKGGGNEKSSFDPRPNPDVEKIPPVFRKGEIAGEQRVKLADLGISQLERALALQPKYRSAMVYLNLLYRQKSLAFFGQPDRWQACVDTAERWRAKALNTKPRQDRTG